jgi:hypothetical protein
MSRLGLGSRSQTFSAQIWCISRLQTAVPSSNRINHVLWRPVIQSVRQQHLADRRKCVTPFQVIGGRPM